MSLFDDEFEEKADALFDGMVSNLAVRSNQHEGKTDILCMVHDSLVAYFNQAPKTPDLLKLGVDKVVIAKVNEIIFEGLLARLKQDRLGDPRRRFKS